MAILTINDILPGVQRPFRLEDMQALWDALNEALASDSNSPVIISGLELTAKGSINVVTSGVMAYKGQLYWYEEGGGLQENGTIWARRLPSNDLRRFGDGTTQDFSYKNVLDGTGNAADGDANIGMVTKDNLDMWRKGFIPDLSITTEKLANGSVTTQKLADNSVTTAKIADLNITTSKIATDAITNDKIADNAVTSSNIAPNAVGSTMLVDNSVTESKLAANSVTNAKIMDGQVTTSKILDGQVTTDKLKNASVTTDKIADANVTNAKLADGAVTAIKIGLGEVQPANLQDNAVVTIKIADGAVTKEKLADNSVYNAKIIDASVTDNKIYPRTITAKSMAANAIETMAIKDKAITAAKLADRSVSSIKIALGAIGTAEVADGVITNPKIANLAVDTNKLANNSVTLAKLAYNSVNYDVIIDGAVTQSKINYPRGSVVLGTGSTDAASSSNNFNVVIGADTKSNRTVENSRSIVIGASSSINAKYANVIGSDNICNAYSTTVIGDNNAIIDVVTNPNIPAYNQIIGSGINFATNGLTSVMKTVAIGSNIAFGNGSTATDNNIIIGRDLRVQPSTSSSNSVSGNVILNTNTMGTGLKVLMCSSCIVIGETDNVNCINAVAIGVGTYTYSTRGVCIGYLARAGDVKSPSSGPNAVAIGYSSYAKGAYSVAIGGHSSAINNQFALGSASSTNSLISPVSLTVTSDKRDKTDIEETDHELNKRLLMGLQPVRFRKNDREAYKLQDVENVHDEHGNIVYYDKEEHAKGTKKGERIRVGFLAQDVQKLVIDLTGDDKYASLITDSRFGDKDITDDGVKLGLVYEHFVPILVDVVQQQQKEIEELKTLVNKMLTK